MVEGESGLKGPSIIGRCSSMRRSRVVGSAVVLGLWTIATGASAVAQQFSSPANAPAAPANEDKGQPVVTAAGITLPSGLYDENADAVKDISRARERARKDNRHVVIMWGENNCEFCVHLYRLYSDDPRIKQLMQTEYELVKVDIGKFTKNVELAKNVYATDLVSIGAPNLTVVNATTNQALGVMAGKDALAKPMTLQRVFDTDYVLNFLDKNKPTPRPAMPLLAEAQQKAKRDGLRVLTYFNVYGSEACAAWDRMSRTSAAASLLEKAFVIRKIDVDRNPGGMDLLRRLKGNSTATPPWMTILDTEGKQVSEAGAGHEFDPSASPSGAIEWLRSASNGKLSPEDCASLSGLLQEGLRPQSAESK